jgi:hypothetical protein
MVRQAAALGIFLTAVVSALGLILGDSASMRAAAMFGGLATGLEVAAVALAAPMLESRDYQGLMVRWALGMLLRMLGVVALPIAVLADRSTFPPLPSALGFLGVLVPLLLFEIRRFR